MENRQELYNQIGLQLKKIRESRGLTLEQVAIILEIHPKVYAKYEAGTKWITFNTIIKLALYYNISVDCLVGLTSNQSTPE